LDEKFRAFCNILYEFTYPVPEPGLKAWAPAPTPPKSGRSTGSGSETLLVKLTIDFAVAGCPAAFQSGSTFVAWRTLND
jgi:hypothetical protein